MLSEVEKRVLAQIDADEVVEWTRELVRIPSVYRPDKGEGEEEVARKVKGWLDGIGLETHWEVVAPGRPNVIGLLKGPAKGRTLMFEGHTDVVTEGDTSAWTHPPFEAQIENGRIYGRGGNDMKGGLVAAILATKAIVDAGVRLGGTILVGALVDEEGRMLGVKHFVEQGWAKGVDAAIICEPEDNRLCTSQKGVMWVKVTVTGKMAHGAMPLTGANPIYATGALLGELRAMEAEEIAEHGKHDFLGQPSITPTIIQSPVRGEAQNNVMPAQCTFTLDIRLIPGQSPEAIEQKFNTIIAKLQVVDTSFRVEYEVIESRPPTATPREEPVVVALHSALQDLTGAEPVYGGVPGSTDGTILFNRAQVPVVTAGPGNWLIPHHVDEFLEIDQLIVATQAYALAALRYLGVAKAT